MKFIIPSLLFLSFTGDKKCPQQGDSTDKRVQQLNVLKNRVLSPSSISVDASITLAAILNSKDDSSKFNMHHAAVIEGYLTDVIQDKGESCNCHSTEEADWDIDLYLSSGRDINGHGACAMAVITPYSATLDSTLKFDHLHSLIGRKVKITGWMLYDFSQRPVSFASHSTKPDRRTVWEIHPVTRFSVE